MRNAGIPPQDLPLRFRLPMPDIEQLRREQTLALLKLLALGGREIERGRHLDADEVYAELAAE